MKIAIVCPYDLGAFGGVQDQVLKLVTWLEAAGHEAWAVGPGEGPEGTVTVGEVTVVPANGAATPISLAPGVSARVREAVEGADVVHVHEPLMPAVSLNATRKLPQPMVGTFHAAPPPWVRAIYRVVSPLATRAAVITAVSPVAAQALGGRVPYRLIPNAVDVAAYRSEDKVADRVGFLGRDDRRKGFDVFESASWLVKYSRPDAELIAVGPADTGHHSAVRLWGPLEEADKQSFFGSCEIFVAPNRGGESFGLVVAEAMAGGCAVIASAIPAFAHVLGDAGVLVPPGDAGAVAGAIVDLLGDEDRRRELQHRALERVRLFDRRRIVDLYIEAYEDALAQ